MPESSLDGGGMGLLLMPHKRAEGGPNALRRLYERAFSSSTELHVLSAYLTEWDKSLGLGKQCKRFKLIVGTDFGITRKQALTDAFDWMGGRKNSFFVHSKPGTSFHPKVMFWKEGAKCFALVGSSNLTRAAFDSNVEGNVAIKLSQSQYSSAMAWIQGLACVEVSRAIIENHQEARRPPRRGAARAPAAAGDDGTRPAFEDKLSWPDPMRVKKGKTVEFWLARRRRERTKFDGSVKAAFTQLARSAASKKEWTTEDNDRFYASMDQVWPSDARIGGGPWRILGKNSDHQELSSGLVKIIDADERDRDDLVLGVLDEFQNIGLGTRGALFTELLCHYFPASYPLMDQPVRKWRSSVGFDRRQGGTEGDRYLRLARAASFAVGQRRPCVPWPARSGRAGHAYLVSIRGVGRGTTDQTG